MPSISFLGCQHENKTYILIIDMILLVCNGYLRFKKIEKGGRNLSEVPDQNIVEWKLEENNKLSKAWKMNSCIITIGN